MAASLARSAGDFMTLVQLIGDAPEGSLPGEDELRNQLRQLLEQIRRTESVAPNEVEEARFALVAWADEAIMRSGWSGAARWGGHSLQMELFRTSKAGVEFFDHLAALQPEQGHAREVYCLVLALGFQGQYAGREADRRALINHQYETLRAAGISLDAVSEARLTPSAYQLDVDLGRRRSGVLGYLALMGLGVALVYGILWAVLSAVSPTVPPLAGV